MHSHSHAHFLPLTHTLFLYLTPSIPLYSLLRLKPASDDTISKVNLVLSDGIYSSSFAKDRTQQNTFALHERLKRIGLDA